MIRTMIENDTAAKEIAGQYGVVESILAEAAKKLPEALAAQVGFIITAKRAADVADINGPFEFVFIAYFAAFKDGDNGWSVFRWSDVSWDELPLLVEEIERVEKQLLPQAVGQESAAAKLESYRKEYGV